MLLPLTRWPPAPAPKQSFLLDHSRELQLHSNRTRSRSCPDLVQRARCLVTLRSSCWHGERYPACYTAGGHGGTKAISTWRPISSKSAAFSVTIVAPISRAEAAISISCRNDRCAKRVRLAGCRRIPLSIRATISHVLHVGVINRRRVWKGSMRARRNARWRAGFCAPIMSSVATTALITSRTRLLR